MAGVASSEILESYREAFTIDDAKARSRSPRAAYSMVNLYCGALADTMCGLRAMFKSVLGADTDKVNRTMYKEMTGRKAYANARDIPWDLIPWSKLPYFAEPGGGNGSKLPHSGCGCCFPLLVLTPPCPDYSSSNPNPKGRHGDKGGGEFTSLPEIVKASRPLIVFIEEVGNLINFPEELISVLLRLQDECVMRVHVALVSMQQYGDIEHSWRIVIVALHESLGLWASNFQIPMGSFSDSVSYTAQDVATATVHIPERFRRVLRDWEVASRSSQPGHLRKVAQCKEGHGPSWAPYACYDLRGVPPKCTTYGAGRHKPLGWRQGDTAYESYMFTPDEVAKHKNFSATVMDFYRRHYDQSKFESEDAWLYHCLGNGFSMKFGHSIYEAIHTTLLLAGVPFDIGGTAVSADGVNVEHVMRKTDDGSVAVQANLAQSQDDLMRRAAELDKHHPSTVYTMCLDTGATEFLCWDEQDGLLSNKRPAHASIVGCKEDMRFSATSRGELLMVCLTRPLPPGLQERVDAKQLTTTQAYKMLSPMEIKQQVDQAMLMEPPVVTAPRKQLRKQLGGFPSVFTKLKLNLSLVQPEDGQSEMWKYDAQFPGDWSRRLRVPLRWNATTWEWQFDYIPIARDSLAHRNFIANVHQDRLSQMSYASCANALCLTVEPMQMQACAFELMNTDMVKELRHINVPEDFQKLMDAVPNDKRIEVVYARDSDDRQVRGVKQNLPDKAKRQMTEQEFHEHYGHMGSGKNCALCAIVKGCMRFIYRVVDKYCETRMGYVFDMDTLTFSTRASCGAKVGTFMRDRAAKYIKDFVLVFKDDFIDQFDMWLTSCRNDPIHQVYNWQFCQVICADNDGVWMRKSDRWLKLIGKHNIRMFYTDKTRKETNSHAESLMKIVEHTGKGCMWQRGLPPTDWVDSFRAAVWLLNRFPPVSALAREPVDGDVARPLEMVLHGWYSRTAINKELCRFVLPGTLILAHNAEAKGSSVSETKSEWVVAKGMLRKQLIVFNPITMAESKIDSYTEMVGPRGYHWRDQLAIPYEAPRACKPLVGDLDLDREAKEQTRFIELTMPETIKTKLKAIKMPTTLSMVKHVDDGAVLKIKRPDIDGLIKKLKKLGVSIPDDIGTKLSEERSGSEPKEGNEVDAIEDDLPDYKVVNHDEPNTAVHTVAPSVGVALENELPLPKSRPSKKPRWASGGQVPPLGRWTADCIKKMAKDYTPIKIRQDNPKQVGSKSWVRYEKYKAATTFSQYKALGGTTDDAKFDLDRGFITIESNDDVTMDEPCGQDGTLAIGGGDVGTNNHEAQPEGNNAEIERRALEIEASEAVTQDYVLEWRSALRRRVFTTSQAMSFAKLCTAMHIPSSFYSVFYSWLLRASGGQVTVALIGKWNVKGTKVVAGVTLPYPSGELWSSMVDDHSSRRFEKETNPNTKEQAHVEWISAQLAVCLKWYMALEEEHIEANKVKVRSKDHISGVPPAPKGVRGVYKISDPERRSMFIAAMIKELSALTDMGTISHNHTADELLSRYGIDIETCPAIPCLMVYENKFPDGKQTVEDWSAKARMCVEGTKRAMQQGVHYDSVFAATPTQDSIIFFNALVVYLRLLRRAFDIGNAYAWAEQENKLALQYPRGLEQYDSNGKQLYMCLHRNTYGKPDGANLWYKERDGFWLDHFNDDQKNPGWTCRRMVMEQTLFEFTYTDTNSDGTITVFYTYLLAWSDDCDCAAQKESHMKYIQDASHARWKVREVSSDFMLGLRRTIHHEGDAMVLTITQEEYIKGVVEAYKEHIKVAGFEHLSPETPTPPNEYLSLDDEVEEQEWKRVLERGYRGVCGSLIWPSRFAHKELAYGCSLLCRVMSKPSERAWQFGMQMIAWLRDNAKRGMRFRSDFDEHGLVASCDSSNKPDPHDGRVQHSHNVKWMGGTIGDVSNKLKHLGYGSPANEYMALRWCAARVIKFRNLFEELGLYEVIDKPTKIYCDNNVAIHWLKTGKITDGNQYMQLAYHQPREWERMGLIVTCAIDTIDNTSDLGTKPNSAEEFKRHLPVKMGYARWEIKFPRPTMTFT